MVYAICVLFRERGGVDWSSYYEFSLGLAVVDLLSVFWAILLVNGGGLERCKDVFV